jgi:hypothetical protein
VRFLDCRDSRKKFRCIATQSNNFARFVLRRRTKLVGYYQVPDLGYFAKNNATARLRHCLEICKWFQIWSDIDSRFDFDDMRGLDESFHRRVVPKVTFESTTTHPSHPAHMPTVFVRPIAVKPSVTGQDSLLSKRGLIRHEPNAGLSTFCSVLESSE